MKISFVALTILMLVSVKAFSLNISPAPISGIIDGSGSGFTDIYISNTTSTSETVNLSMTSQAGFSILINRCNGRTLTQNQSCYIRMGADQNQMSAGTFQSVISNNGSPLFTFKFTKNALTVTETSEFMETSESISDFGSRTLRIKNKTSSVKNYAPTFSGINASKFSILLNRCTNVAPNTTCTISYQLKPQIAGSYSASFGEPQISNSVSISSNITVSTPGVLPPFTSQFSLSTGSLNFGTLIRYGQSVPQNITIQNIGNTTLYPVLEFSNKTQLALNRCSSIQVGSSCVLSISVNPTFDMSNGPILNQYVVVKANALDTGVTVNVNANLLYIASCPANTHLDSGNCVSNTRSCSIPNGSGTETWSSGNWGSCQNLVCDSNYSLDMSGLACTLSNTESSYAEASVGSGRVISNGLIIHSVIGSELSRPSYSNGLIIWTGDYK